MSMKANELKVTDLMVGDLVQIKEKDGKKLVGAFRVVAIGKTYLGGVISDFVENGTVSISYIEDEKRVYQTEVCNIEPISLTPEILEKNGLTNDYHGSYFEEDEHISLEISTSEYGIYWTINCHEYRILKLEYVHELQHALKLCGINKEIVV